jgi:hypothetical protein
MPARDQVGLVGDHHFIRDVDRRMAREHALVADVDFSADRDVQAVVGIERRDQRERAIDRLTDQLLKGLSNLLRFVIAKSAELGGQPRRNLDSPKYLASLLGPGFDPPLPIVHRCLLSPALAVPERSAYPDAAADRELCRACEAVSSKAGGREIGYGRPDAR